MVEERFIESVLERGGVSRLALAYAATILRRLSTRTHSD